MNTGTRLKLARDKACFTVSDMAAWFGVSRAAMNTWLHNDRQPLFSTATQLEPLIFLLEKTLSSKTTKGLLPVPLSIRQYERKEYIDKVKAHALREFPKANSAQLRPEVLD